MDQGDSGQGSRPAVFFIRTVTFKRGSSEVAILCDMHSFMPVGFSHVFIYE